MASLDFRSEQFNFKKYYSADYARLDNARQTFSTLISSMLSAEQDIKVCTISSRVKNREESVKKFANKYQEKLEELQIPYEIKDHISDLLGLRIVTLYESDIQKIAQVLKSEFDVIGVTDKTGSLESKGNAFGYKGLHLDLKLSAARTCMREYKPYADLCFEVQIRTLIQDAWSVLDHQIKYKRAIPQYLERRINSLAAMFEIADREFLDIHEATQAEEQKAQTGDRGDEIINSFTMAQIIKEMLPEFAYDEHRVSEGVDFILSYGDLSGKQLKNAIEQHHATVSNYISTVQSNVGKSFKVEAFVILAHILYASNPKKYKGLLFGFAQEQFMKFLNKTQKNEC